VKRPAAVRVVGPVEWILYPSLAVIVATLIFAVPVELFGFKLPEPVLPMMLAFAWPLVRPSMIAPVALFFVGLFVDLLWGGMLGVWPLSLLAVYGVVLLSRNLLAGQETQVLFVWYGCCTLLAFFLTYLIVSLDAVNAPSILALLGQMIPTLLLFPVANWMIQRFDDGDTRFR
jgi:rod shape-determining protein MreD